MSIPTLHKAIKWSMAHHLPAPQFHLLVLLAYHDNPEHGCFPSQKTLSKESGIPERTVRYHLRAMVETGVIKVLPRGRRNGYKLRLKEGKKKSATGNPLPQSDPLNSGNPLPVLYKNTGYPLPVDSGNPLPVTMDFDKHTGNPLPLVLKSKSEKILKCNSKVENPGPDFDGGTETSPIDTEENQPVKTEEIIQKVMTPKTLEEIFAILNQKKVSGGTLAKVWRAAHALYHPELTLPEMTRKLQGQLAHAYRLSGPPLGKALVTVVEDWAGFLLYVKTNYSHEFKGTPSLPTMPNVGFLLKHVHAALNFEANHMPQASVKIVQAPKPPPAPVHLTKQQG